MSELQAGTSLQSFAGYNDEAEYKHGGKNQ